jgi:hypothetical protein
MRDSEPTTNNMAMYPVYKFSSSFMIPYSAFIAS